MGNCSIFIDILDNSRRNASTVLALNKKDDPQKVNSLDFGWELVQNLTTPFIENRSLNGLSSMVQQKMCVILKGKITSRNPSAELFPAKNKQRKKCILCINDSHGTGYKSIKANLPKHSTQCQKCSECVCSDHFMQICFNCSTNMTE